MAVVPKPEARPRFVLDGSVALSWCFPDEKSRRTQRLLESLRGASVAVPSLWLLEVSNALLSGERRGRLTEAEATEALRLLGRLPVDVDQCWGLPFASDVLAIARQYELTAYDAAYLELARRRKLPLATLDGSLRRAAKRAGVTLYAA
jgi:predicted nucleic acid-binding protein